MHLPLKPKPAFPFGGMARPNGFSIYVADVAEFETPAGKVLSRNRSAASMTLWYWFSTM